MLPRMTRDDDIPPLRRAEDRLLILTQADLWRHWRALLGPLGFSERLLWVTFIDADAGATPVLQQISELPPVPDTPLLNSLIHTLGEVCDELGGGSAAMLLSRPGRTGITAVERVWGQRLTATATESGVRLWPLHLANDGELVALTPDDLVAPRSAAG